MEPKNDDSLTKTQEWRSFLFLSVVMAPVLAVIIVAGWGFLVWMFQLVAGKLVVTLEAEAACTWAPGRAVMTAITSCACCGKACTTRLAMWMWSRGWLASMAC